ncbi:LysR family transcriptional regulator [Rhodospirillum sp. A1_3_36]|uniref:LysR family transcriptional regulator n=1 Tax=Rhodospirillum sp. A1_3_36 TaxID=3391666 RepID=UPI0039A59F4C
MRLPLPMIEVFEAIAREGSLRGAADALALKPSTVSHQLKSLEDRLGTELFIRSTRSISLTEAGRTLFRGASPAFEQLTEAFEAARTTGHTARGRLRLTVPMFAYELVVAEKLTDFMALYPDIEIEMSFTDALEDILTEGMHAGFRLGNLVDQDMIAVRLTGKLAVATVASPQYLAENGTPDTPDALLNHMCLRYRFKSSGRLAPWLFDSGDGQKEVAVGGKLIVNDLGVLVDMAKRGRGLVYLFRNYVTEELNCRALVEVLSPFAPQIPGIHIYFPREYRNMSALRLFVEFLKA